MILLTLLSQQASAESVELACASKGDPFLTLLQIERGGAIKNDVMKTSVLFDKETNEAILVYENAFYAYWNDHNISIKHQFSKHQGFVDRETLEFSYYTNPPFGESKHDCEISDNLEAKIERWKRQAARYDEAQRKAQRAKNKI